MMEKNRFDESCHILESWPKDSKKLVLFFGSIFHRTKYPLWKIPSQITNDLNSRFVSVDWPKQEFDKDKVKNQITDYIKNSWAEEVVTIWLSFWHMVATDIISSLPKELKSKVKWHISICWVNSYEDLTLWYKLSVSVLSRISKNLAWTIWLIDRYGSLDIPKSPENARIIESLSNTMLRRSVNNPVSKKVLSKLKNFISWNMVFWKSEIPDWINPSQKREYLLNRHMRNASMWLTPGLVDRFKQIRENYWNSSPKFDFPIISIFSDNDDMFSDPENNAKKITQKTVGSTELIGVNQWWHASILEIPQAWDGAVLAALENFGWKNSKN